MRKLACILVAAAVCAPVLEGEARAQQRGAVSITAMSVGTAGGLVSSIAAIVYAADGRAFDAAWVMISFITSAVCLGTVIGLAPDADNGLVLMGVLINAALGTWPLYWTARTAWSDVELGEQFEPEATVPGPSAAPGVVVPLVAFRF